MWSRGSIRAAAIRSFLKENPGQTSADDIARLAADLDRSRVSVFRLIKLFREGGTVMTLVERKRGRSTGHRTLASEREEIINAAINKHYLKRTRPSISQLVRNVQVDCHLTGLKPQHRRPIVARLEDFDQGNHQRQVVSRIFRTFDHATTASWWVCSA